MLYREKNRCLFWDPYTVRAERGIFEFEAWWYMNEQLGFKKWIQKYH